jgi:hypothetical protein
MGFPDHSITKRNQIGATELSAIGLMMCWLKRGSLSRMKVKKSIIHTGGSLWVVCDGHGCAFTDDDREGTSTKKGMRAEGWIRKKGIQ